MTFRPIYPTKFHRIQEAKRELISNPKTKEEAQVNKQIMEQVKHIEEVF